MGKGGRRCATLLMARMEPTLVAADQVACEFVKEQRVEFLAQAIRREDESLTEADSKALAELWLWVRS